MLQLHDPQGRWPWLTWAAWFEANGVTDLVPGGTLTYDQYDQVINAALHGQGVALARHDARGIPRRRTAGSCRSSAGACRFRAPCTRSSRRARAQRPEAQAFVAWLKKEIG